MYPTRAITAATTALVKAACVAQKEFGSSQSGWLRRKLHERERACEREREREREGERERECVCVCVCIHTHMCVCVCRKISLIFIAASGAKYNEDSEWSSGLVSAAKMVAVATGSLCDAANATMAVCLLVVVCFLLFVLFVCLFAFVCLFVCLLFVVVVIVLLKLYFIYF